VKDQIADVAALHRILDNAGGWTDEAIELRRRLCEEEAKELAEALGYHAPPWERAIDRDDNGNGSYRKANKVEAADAAADLAYVALGSLIEFFGENAARRVWNEVQRSNMAKFPDGKVIKREDGKGLKPPGWTPPDIAGALEDW
jgi:predicted HAD superfamily Cof-like phosphohydrolase